MMGMLPVAKGNIFTELHDSPQTISNGWRPKKSICHLVKEIKKKKKEQYACAHTLITLCVIKEWGRGNEREKYTVVVRMGWSQAEDF